MNPRARRRLAAWGGVLVAIAVPVVPTLFWDRRCQGADELCALGFLVWLVPSLIFSPLVGATIAVVLAPVGDRTRAMLIALTVPGALLWGLLAWGHLAWGWPLFI